MVAPILYQLCDAAHVSGLTLTAEIGLGATIGYQAEIHADSIEIKGIDTDSDIITIDAPLPLGALIGGTKYESLDYSMLVDWAHLDAESNLAGALLHDWSPDTSTGIWFKTNTTGLPTWWEVFVGGSDTVESSYTSLTNGARYVLFLRYVAATQTATFWVIDSDGVTLSEDSLVLTNPLIWDTVANSLRHSFFRGYVYRRAYWAAALTPEAALASINNVELTARSVSNAGGSRLDLYTSQLEDGQYLVFIGPNGDNTDTPAYPVTRGAGRVVRVTNGYFTVVTPVLPIGGPYYMTFSAVSAGANSKISTEFLTVVPRNYTSSTFSLRRNMFQQTSAGALSLLDVPYPQE